MHFKSLMHISFICNNFEEMLDFYGNKLGLNKKVEVKYGEYVNRDDRPAMQEIARVDPDRIYYVYFEFAKGQFIELFPKNENMAEPIEYGTHNGYNHFALLTDDINETYKEFKAKDMKIVAPLSKGPSETYQFWAEDPDGNRFEVMQFTNKSYQVVGHIL